MITATITNPRNMTNILPKKGMMLVDVYSVVAINDNGPNEVVVSKIYTSGTQHTPIGKLDVSAETVIISPEKDIYVIGFGHVPPGEKFYSRKATAVGKSLENAGIVLSQSIDGAGDGAIIKALAASAIAAGHDTSTLYAKSLHSPFSKVAAAPEARPAETDLAEAFSPEPSKGGPSL